MQSDGIIIAVINAFKVFIGNFVPVARFIAPDENFGIFAADLKPLVAVNATAVFGVIISVTVRLVSRKRGLREYAKIYADFFVRFAIVFNAYFKNRNRSA